MKHDQAEVTAKKNAGVMFEYLEKFMQDSDTIYGVMEFSSSNNRLVVDITINQDGKEVFGRGYDMGISAIYADLLTRELIRLLQESFISSDEYGISGYACIKDHPTMSRDGVYVFNTHNSRVNVNFRVKGSEFSEIMNEHDAKITEYRRASGVGRS